MMLQLFGLIMNFIPGITHYLKQIQFQQAMVANDFKGDFSSGSRKARSFVGLVIHQSHLRQSLNHIGG